MKASFFIIATFCCSLAAAQDTLVLLPGFNSQPINSYFRYFHQDQEISADSAWKLFQPGHQTAQQLDKINFGPVQGYYWLKLTLINQTQVSQELFLEIRQPHLYQIRFYRLQNNEPILRAETGIRYNFHSRPTPNRYFDFPISMAAGESVNVLLMIHHINSLTLPLHLITSGTLHERNYSRNLAWGYWLGFLSFCALFALLASLLLKKRVFLWYFLYISAGVLYGFTELGFAFQYIFPNQAGLDAPAIIHTSIYPLLFLIKFSQGLLTTKENLPIVHKLLNIVFYFLLTMVLAGIALTETMFQYSYFILPAVNFAILIGMLSLAYSGIKSLFINRIIAIFYLLAYMALVSAAVFVMINYAFGWYQYQGPNPILIAYFFEAMLLSVALIILYRQTQREKTVLLQKVTTQQKELYQQFITGVEKERSRIAGDLHDDIGSRLSYLKRLLSTSNTNKNEDAQQLDQIIEDVRKLAHDLAPPMAHVTGLLPLIEKLVAEIRALTKLDIKLQAHNFTCQLKPEAIQQVYRMIQESLNNIVKHSQATRADIQFFNYETEIVITIDDNGVGFELVQEGLGLNQLKVRSASLGGYVDIQSRTGAGCHIMITIPIESIRI